MHQDAPAFDERGAVRSDASSTVLRWFPAAQSIFIVGATFVSVFPFLVLARIYEPQLCPPLHFYATLLPVYVGVPVWLLRPWYAVFVEWLEDAVAGVVSAGASADEQKGSGGGPGPVLRKRRVEMGAVKSPIPVSHAWAILVLSVWTSAHVAWLSVYSGGPILGPLGQVLLALALFAPSIAFHPKSIMLTYAFIILAAGVAQTVASHWGMEAPSDSWYWGLTFGVLIVSGAIATFVRRGEIRRARTERSSGVGL